MIKPKSGQFSTLQPIVFTMGQLEQIPQASVSFLPFLKCRCENDLLQIHKQVAVLSKSDQFMFSSLHLTEFIIDNKRAENFSNTLTELRHHFWSFYPFPCLNEPLNRIHPSLWFPMQGTVCQSMWVYSGRRGEGMYCSIMSLVFHSFLQ